MEIQEYFKKKKDLQNYLLNYLDKETKADQDRENFFKQIDIINSSNINEMKIFLQLIIQISNNHHRQPNFYDKLEEILLPFIQTIKQTFSNIEIFEFFQSNKRLLLFLIEQNILIIDEQIYEIIQDENYQRKDYLIYFWPEIEKFTNDELKKRIEEENEDIFQTSSRLFESNRKEGENDSIVCKMIRNDSLDEFIIYFKSTEIFNSKSIYSSAFETNQFLEFKKPTLIEYADFFGSIKIFNYLSNHFEITPSLWLYSIHGRNLEIIQFLEKKKIEPDDKSFSECFIEAVKCHHNEIADYIQNKLIVKNHSDHDDFYISSKIVQCLNFNFFPNDLNNIYLFYNFCQYNFISFVEIVLKNIKIDLNSKIFQRNPSGLNIISIQNNE